MEAKLTQTFLHVKMEKGKGSEEIGEKPPKGMFTEEAVCVSYIFSQQGPQSGTKLESCISDVNLNKHSIVHRMNDNQNISTFPASQGPQRWVCCRKRQRSNIYR